MRDLRVYHRKEHERWMKDVLGLEKDFRPSRRAHEDEDHSRLEQDYQSGRERWSTRDSRRDGYRSDRYRHREKG